MSARPKSPPDRRLALTFEAANVHDRKGRRRPPLSAIESISILHGAYLGTGCYGGTLKVRGVNYPVRPGEKRMGDIITDLLKSTAAAASAGGCEVVSIHIAPHPDPSRFCDYEPQVIWKPKPCATDGRTCGHEEDV